MRIEILYCVLLSVVLFISLLYIIISNILKNKKSKNLSDIDDIDKIDEAVEVTTKEFDTYTRESIAMHKYNSPISEYTFSEMLSRGTKIVKRDNLKINDKIVKESGYHVV